MTAKPTPGQLQWQDLAFGMFCHFGINTFYGKEWSDGSLKPAGFNPRRLDARQWVETARAAGMRYLIFTAKHHDGFCLWPSNTTGYSLAASPYKGGKGDVVGELAAACRDAGMPFGLYLSPWDRHEPCYANPEAYDRFYVQQLTELCTRYGPLFEVWFDGAGSQGRTYHWDAIMEVVDRYQPGAMVFNMGRPTIRWIGNEDGLAADPNYYAVNQLKGSAAYSEARLASGAQYIPPECDVSIRRGWFWHPDEEHTLKSAEHLLGIYYRSIGLGANLLLNVPPNRDGLIADEDRARLLEMAAELRRRFDTPIPGRIEQGGQGGQDGRDGQDGARLRVTFDQPAEFDHLVLRERLDEGQRVNGYAITAEPDGVEIARGVTIGAQRILAFPSRRAQALRITLSTPGVRLHSVTAHRTGHCELPTLGQLLQPGDLAARVD